MVQRTNLDIIRIFAAWMVLSVHIYQYAGIDFSVGAKGVQLFFILSGYLAFASLDGNSSPILYYKKRLVRILPVYWTCLLIIYIEDLILGILSSSLADTLAEPCSPRYLRYFVFLQCFTPTNNWDLWNNRSALWTMSSFIGFYILAPYLYRIINQFYKGISLLIILLFGRPYLASWIQNTFSGYPEEAHIEWFANMNPLTELYCFLLGAVLFLAIKQEKQNIYLIMITIILAVTAFSWYQYEFLFVLLVATGVLSKPVTQNEKACKWISRISGGSFALYLIHPMVLKIAPAILDCLSIRHHRVYAACLYVLCIGAAYLLYYGLIIRLEKWASKKFLAKNTL